MKTKKWVPFVTIAVLLYLLFISMDFLPAFRSVSTNFLKYIFILNVFFLSLLGKKRAVCIGLFLTLLCDAFLLFTDRYFTGILLFCFVHMVYIHMQRKEIKKQGALLPVLAPSVILIGTVYAGLFALDLYTAWKNVKIGPSRKTRFFFAALCLFACCDICTALYQITGISVLASFIWVFYGPSQIMIALYSLLD